MNFLLLNMVDQTEFIRVFFLSKLQLFISLSFPSKNFNKHCIFSPTQAKESYLLFMSDHFLLSLFWQITWQKMIKGLILQCDLYVIYCQNKSHFVNWSF